MNHVTATFGTYFQITLHSLDDDGAGAIAADGNRTINFCDGNRARPIAANIDTTADFSNIYFTAAVGANSDVT